MRRAFLGFTARPLVTFVITLAVAVSLLVTLAAAPLASAAPPAMQAVTPGHALAFPADFGAHPAFRTEWWYATGWLEQPDGKPLGFQVTFFRSATAHDADNPSRFAPKQLVIAHAALSDPTLGKLLHGQKIAREGFGLAWAKTGNTDVRLDDWRLQRSDGTDAAKRSVYETTIRSGDFALSLRMAASQPPLLQGEQGYSRKGAQAAQASYYYSEPQLVVTGSVTRSGLTQTVRGTAWLDHEWSTTALDDNATGWDWTGINLADGGALMAFQIRGKDGEKLWAHATMRDTGGGLTQFAANEVLFRPRRSWRSARTGASYPVAMSLQTGNLLWQLDPLQDDQELDSRLSTGAVYWEGAVTVRRSGAAPPASSSASVAPNNTAAIPSGTPAGHGYLELTGYFKPLKL